MPVNSSLVQSVNVSQPEIPESAFEPIPERVLKESQKKKKVKKDSKHKTDKPKKDKNLDEVRRDSLLQHNWQPEEPKRKKTKKH